MKPPSVKTKNVIICYMVRAISHTRGRDKWVHSNCGMATGMEKSNFIKHISHVKSSEIEAEKPSWQLGN